MLFPLEVVECCIQSPLFGKIRTLTAGMKIIVPADVASVLLSMRAARVISPNEIAKIKMTDFIETAPRLLELVTPPAVEPATVAEAKQYLRVDTDAEDTVISNLITAARQAVEQYIRKSLITQTWKLVYNTQVSQQVMLPMGPVQSIASVVTTSRDGAQVTLDSDNYYLNAAKVYLVFDVTPEEHEITITYTAGYGSSASSVPMAIRQGILVYLAAMFDGRESTDMPEKAAALLSHFRAIAV